MNTTLPTVSGRIERPPQSSHYLQSDATRRVGLLDRLALRLGVALITWSRRTIAVDARAQHQRELEREQALLRRERVWTDALQATILLR